MLYRNSQKQRGVITETAAQRKEKSPVNPGFFFRRLSNRLDLRSPAGNNYAQYRGCNNRFPDPAGFLPRSRLGSDSQIHAALPRSVLPDTRPERQQDSRQYPRSGGADTVHKLGRSGAAVCAQTLTLATKIFKSLLKGLCGHVVCPQSFC